MRLTEVRDRAERLAEALVDLEPRLGVGWVTYVLECVEDQAEAEDVRLLLACLVENVNGRLERGSW